MINKEKNLILAIDFLGPKNLDTKEIIWGLILSFNQGLRRIEPLNNKTTNELITKFIDFLHYSGLIPDYIQSDNDTSIVGNVAGQLNFGRFIRLCLNLKITPIFIPEGEPYYNGLAETVVSLFVKKIWHPNYFENKKDVNQAIISFSDEYCQRLKRKKFTVILKNKNYYQNSILNKNEYTVEELSNKLLLTSSRKIIFLRHVKEHFECDYSFINIMSNHIEIPKKYIGFYAAALYNTKTKVMKIYIKQNNKLFLIKEIKFKIKI